MDDTLLGPGLNGQSIGSVWTRKGSQPDGVESIPYLTR